VAESETVAGGARSGLSRRKSSFAGDVLKLVSGTTFAQALSILIAPILSRLYAPDAFGTAAVFVSITGIISVVACLRYELAIMLPEQDEDAANLLAVSLSLALSIAGLSAVLIVLLHGPIVRLLNAPDLTPYLWLVPLGVLTNGVFLALNYWNSRTKHFGRLSIARISQSVVTSGTQLGMGVVGQAHAGGLISAGVLGSAVVTAVLGGQIWRDDQQLFRGNVRLGRMSDGLRRYRKFPLLDIWGALLNSVSWQLPVLMLSVLFSQTVVGYYAFANRLIQLPMALIGGALAQVFFQRASEAHAKQTDLASVVEMVFRRLVALGLFPALLMTIVGRELFVVVFGQNWAEAGIYVQILGLWMFFWFISSPLSTLYVVLERQELGLILHVAILITRISSLAIGGLLGNVYLALGLFAGSGVFVYGGLTILNMVLAGVSLPSCFCTLLQYGLYSVPAVLILLLLKLWYKADMWLIFAVTAVALLTYYAFILRRDTDLRRHVLSALPRAWKRI
jgi:O-antigen/teichoic acid export membrane protein